MATDPQKDESTGLGGAEHCRAHETRRAQTAVSALQWATFPLRLAKAWPHESSQGTLISHTTSAHTAVAFLWFVPLDCVSKDKNHRNATAVCSPEGMIARFYKQQTRVGGSEWRHPPDTWGVAMDVPERKVKLLFG